MNSTTSPDRGFLGWVMLARMIGCLLVILGHSYPFCTRPEVGYDLVLAVRDFIYRFHMPLFVGCSGYLLAYTGASDRHPFPAFVRRRALRLLLPYLAFSLIGIGPKILFSEFLNDHLALDAMPIVRAFLVPRENVWGHFWFLPMLFSLGLLGYGIDALDRRRPVLPIAVALGLLLMALPDAGPWFGLTDVQRHFLYFVLGMAAAKHGLSFGGGGAALGVGLSAVAFAVPFPCAGVLTAVSMSYAIFFLCGRIGHLAEAVPSTLRRTYPIFILSWPCQLTAEVVLERILHCPYYLVMGAMVLAGVVGPLVVLRLTDAIDRRLGRGFFHTILGERT